MRNMSFMLTKQQVLLQTKSVTRRMGWWNAKPGDVLQPVEKGMGLKRGERVVYIGCQIRVLDVRDEQLNRMLVDRAYGIAEVELEGFGDDYQIGTPETFVPFFCRSHSGCKPDTLVNRIEFEYTVPLAFCSPEQYSTWPVEEPKMDAS